MVKEPVPTFSTCFGEPFMPMDASVYAKMLGEKIETIFEGETKAGSNKYFLHTNNFSAGVYFIRYRIGEVETVKRLIVK